jgi:hypothetical protein
VAKMGLRRLKSVRDVLELAEVVSRRLRCLQGASKCGEGVLKMTKIASCRLRCAEVQYFQFIKQYYVVFYILFSTFENVASRHT